MCNLNLRSGRTRGSPAQTSAIAHTGPDTISRVDSLTQLKGANDAIGEFLGARSSRERGEENRWTKGDQSHTKPYRLAQRY
jgi:hypothetical protein